MQGVMDQESRCLESKILTRLQIEDIRSFFIQILRPDKSLLDFNHFSTLITQLVGRGVDQILIEQFFKTFDLNNDLQLDWNGYLKQFVNGLLNFNYVKTLKLFPLLQTQKRYLSLLQVENLISPFIMLDQLNKVQVELVQMEKQIPSLLLIKGCYFLCCLDIPITDNLLALPSAINIQNLFIALSSQILQLSAIRSIVDLLTLLVKQRCPHQLQAIGNYYIPLLQALSNQELMEPILKLLLNKDEDGELILATLQYLTLLVYGLTQYNIKSDSFVGLVSLIFQQFLHQQNSIRYQALLCISHLIIWNPQNIEWCHQNDIPVQLMLIEEDDNQFLLYHSWLLSCLAGRYEQGSLEQFIIRINHPDYGEKCKQWVVEVQKYTKLIMDTYLVYDQNPLVIQILVNILQLNSPLLCTPNNLKHIWNFLLLAIDTASEIVNHTIKKQVLIIIKKIYILPLRLDFDNSEIQIYLLQNGLTQDLLLQAASGEQDVRESALKLLLSSLSHKCAPLIARYLEETQTQSSFLSLLMQLFTQITDKFYPGVHASYQLLTLKALIYLSQQDGAIFQDLSYDQLLFMSLMQVIESFHKSNQLTLEIFQDKHKFYNLSFDHHVWILSGIYLELFLKHFQNIFINGLQVNEQQIERIMPTQKTIEFIAQYLEYYFVEMKTFKPLYIKKYLKLVYSNVLNCIFIIGQFTTQLLEFCNKITVSNNCIFFIRLEVQRVLELTMMAYDNYANRTTEIENLLVLAGSQNLINEGNIVQIYLNQYSSAQQCKLVLFKQMTLLDFEKQIEKGLLTTQPQIYLVVNHNDPQKSLHEQTIIGESTFEKFKYLALQLVETYLGISMIPQEIIAVDLYKMKFIDEFTMRRLFQVMRNGTKYLELISMKRSSLLWNLEGNNLNFNDERAVLELLTQETQLNFYQLQNLHKVQKLNYICYVQTLLNFLQQRGIQMNNFHIGAVDFVDFLTTRGVPYRVANRLQLFLSKQGFNNPVDYRDFVCFLACVQANQESNITLKLIFLIYMDQSKGVFGLKQVEDYLKDMISIQQTSTPEEQLKEWAQELLSYVDYNHDGYISYFEFHTLLGHSQYKARLLDPLQQILDQLTQQRQNHFFGGSQPNNLFQNIPQPMNDGFNPSYKRDYGIRSNNYFYND